MATAWARLPNAKLIDAVLADVAARPKAWGVARDAARDVIYALAAWDDCTYMLDLPSTTLRTMADICDAPACHQAVLLLPYVLVKESK